MHRHRRTVGRAFATGSVDSFMWVSMGALMATAAEPAGSYRSRLRQVAVASIFGALGFLAGYIVALPWVLVVAGMAVLGIAAGLVSAWGAKFSIGAMQFLLLASIAIGLPGEFSYWQAALLFVAGAAVALLLLGLEAALLRTRPERDLIARLGQALAALAARRADLIEAGGQSFQSPDAQAARRAVTDALGALAVHAMDTGTEASGRSGEADALAATIERGDNAFSAILSSDDGPALRSAATRLAAAGPADAHGVPPLSAPQAAPGTLASDIETFIAAAGGTGSGAPFRSSVPAAKPGDSGKRSGMALVFARLTPGRDNWRDALALGLCIALAYSVRWVDDDPHWFWVPLTVSLIMKPDLGSVFGRAVLRSAGTVVGVVIGAAILGLVPKGPALVAVFAILAAMLPSAMRISYGVQSIVLTPLVLVFVSMIEPVKANVDLAVPRLVATVAGSAIVLVFGYFPWRRPPGDELAARFHKAKAAIAAYLEAVASKVDESRPRRFDAYAALANLRARLQVLLVEPPPVGREAAAWFPLLAGAERICDRVTIFAAREARPVGAREAGALDALATYVAASPSRRATMPLPAYAGDDPDVAALVSGVAQELHHMARISADGQFPEANENP